MDAQLNPPLARFANCSRTWWRRTSNGIGDDSWPAAWSPWSCSAWSSRRPFFWPGARIPRPRGHPSPPAFLSRSGSPAPYPRKASTGHGSPVNIYIFLIFNKINKILQYLLDLLDSPISSFIVWWNKTKSSKIVQYDSYIEIRFPISISRKDITLTPHYTNPKSVLLNVTRKREKKKDIQHPPYYIY